MDNLTPHIDEAAIELTVTDLVEQLFANGSAMLRTEDGADLRAERIASHRNVMTVHAPTLALEQGLRVTGACNAPDPWAVTFVVRNVEPFSPSTDTVVLEAVQSSLYPERRRAPRVEVGGEAIVTVHHGVEMVEQERVRAVLVNVSATGIAFASSAELGENAHVTIDARPLFGRLTADLSVRWRGPSRVPEMQLYGCRIVAIDGANAEVLARLVAGESSPAVDTAASTVEELRQAFSERSGRRRFLRWA